MLSESEPEKAADFLAGDFFRERTGAFFFAEDLFLAGDFFFLALGRGPLALRCAGVYDIGSSSLSSSSSSWATPSPSTSPSGASEFSSESDGNAELRGCFDAKRRASLGYRFRHSRATDIEVVDASTLAAVDTASDAAETKAAAAAFTHRVVTDLVPALGGVDDLGVE